MPVDSRLAATLNNLEFTSREWKFQVDGTTGRSEMPVVAADGLLAEVHA
jgi:hypothetical protein